MYMVKSGKSRFSSRKRGAADFAFFVYRYFWRADVKRIGGKRVCMNNEKDLTSGNLWKQIMLFSLPLMLSNVLQVLFNLSDIFVVSNFSGNPNSLGAVGQTSTLVVLFTGFAIGMGSGVNALTAHFIGSKNDKDLRETIHTSAIVCLIVGVVLCAILFFAAGLCLKLVDTSPTFFADAKLYLKIYAFGMPALALYNFGNGVLSAAGDTKRPLIYLAIAGVINVLLNLFFVIVCKLDVAGVAIASIISQYISAILIFISLLRNKGGAAVRLKHLKITPEKARKILALGLPAGFQNSIFSIANLFIQKAVNSFNCDTIVNGNTAAANADALIYDLLAAYYTACSSFMGQNFGAGKKDRMRASYRISLIYSFGTGILAGGALLLFGRQFLSIFTKNPAEIEDGMQRLVVMGASYAVSSFMDCTIAASRGLGKSFVPTIIVISGSCVFRVIWIYTIFAHFHTVPSLYLLYPCSWILTAIAEIIYYLFSYKKISKRLDEKQTEHLAVAE